MMSTVNQQQIKAGHKMMTLKQVREALKDRRVDKVANATGIHYNTVREVRDNEDANPTWRVLKALNDYLEEKTNA